MCQPEVHRFNSSTIILYQACSDQVIVGPSGVIGLNDLAINNAMDRYFKVKKSDRLPLSLAVRDFFSKVLKYKKESQE